MSWPEKKPIDSYYVIEEKHLEIDHDEGVDKLKIIQKKHINETPERQKAVMPRMHTIAGDIHENVVDEDDFKVKRGNKVPKRAVDEEEMKKMDRRPSMTVTLNDQWALSKAGQKMSVSVDNAENREGNKVWSEACRSLCWFSLCFYSFFNWLTDFLFCFLETVSYSCFGVFLSFCIGLLLSSDSNRNFCFGRCFFDTLINCYCLLLGCR